MKIVAKSRFIQASPTKLRKILLSVSGKNLQDLALKLKFNRSFKARILLKTLNSALNSAKERGFQEDSLKITEFKIDQGPGYKRLKIKSRGRSDTIKKKTSHITVILEGEKENPKSKIRNPKQITKSKIQNSKHKNKV